MRAARIASKINASRRTTEQMLTMWQHRNLYVYLPSCILFYFVYKFYRFFLPGFFPIAIDCIAAADSINTFFYVYSNVAKNYIIILGTFS